MNPRADQLHRDSSRGASPVELTLGVFLLIALVLATYDLSRAARSYESVSRAAEEGARYAGTFGAQGSVYGSHGDAAAEAQIEAVAKAAATGLDPDLLDVGVAWNPRDSSVMVRVEYGHSILGLIEGVELVRESTLAMRN